jgi:hypothetical protein
MWLVRRLAGSPGDVAKRQALRFFWISVCLGDDFRRWQRSVRFATGGDSVGGRVSFGSDRGVLPVKGKKLNKNLNKLSKNVDCQGDVRYSGAASQKKRTRRGLSGKEA